MQFTGQTAEKPVSTTCLLAKENIIDWLGKWRPTCVMRHARGQKLQSFRRKWHFCMDLYSVHKVIQSHLSEKSVGDQSSLRIHAALD